MLVELSYDEIEYLRLGIMSLRHTLDLSPKQSIENSYLEIKLYESITGDKNAS